MDSLDDPVEWVKLTMLQNLEADSLMLEPEFLPTCLHAGVVCYSLQKWFGGGCTQAEIIAKFKLHQNILSLCVTGK